MSQMLRVPATPEEIVEKGLGQLASLKDVHAWKFGENVWSFSQDEDGRLRALDGLVRGYLEVEAPERPLCLAVFGQPGSGKSFSVKNLAEAVAKSGAPLGKPETLNLTQFESTADLASRLAAFAQSGESGKVPFVFFDEFDTSLAGTPLGWLSWFLAPMQDGEFAHQGQTVALKRAVYVFAGGTASTLAAFNRTEPSAFRAAKGPDFVSRLRGFLDVRGPNDAENLRYRRAMGLRIALDKVGKSRDTKLRLDPALRDAALAVGRFTHGMRSMEAFVEMTAMQAKPGRPLIFADLPLDHLLAMHVDRGPLDPQTIDGLMGLSGGGGEPGSSPSEVSRDETWRALATMLWAQGATLAYGGDWSKTGLTWRLLETLDELPRRLSRDDATIDRRLEVFALSRPDSAVDARRVTIAQVPAPRPLKNSRVQRAAHLFRMRWMSGSRCRARILLSGKSEGYSGRFPGIFEEAMVALALRQPVYVLGAFGGAAGALGGLLGLGTQWSKPVRPGSGLPIGTAHEHLFRPPSHPELPLTLDGVISFLAGHAFGTPGWVENGLSVDENRELFALRPNDSKRAVELIRTGLLRVFRG